MSIEVGIWRIDEESKPVLLTGMDLEKRLQDILADDISLIGQDLLVIGREVLTPSDGRIDILAINALGNLVVIELKRDRTPRDVVAQVLDYASWVRELDAEDIQRTFVDYQTRFGTTSAPQGVTQALRDAFGKPPTELNSSHQMVIVAGALDPATERIVGYLRDEHEVDINVALFRAFEDGGRQYLTRAWLEDAEGPGTDPARGAPESRSWNGEFYVNFEEGEHRNWADARKYGFVSAGGGPRFQSFMERLQTGSVVWAYIPKAGYVGMGHVTSEAVHFSEFAVKVQGQDTSITDLETRAVNPFDVGYDQYFVGVKWRKTVDVKNAVFEPGLFANQNTVARPKTEQWQFTVELLRRMWGIE